MPPHQITRNKISQRSNWNLMMAMITMKINKHQVIVVDWLQGTAQSRVQTLKRGNIRELRLM